MIIISLIICLIIGGIAGFLCDVAARHLTGGGFKISLQTFAPVAACAALFAGAYIKIGFAVPVLPVYALFAVFVCVSLCDIRKRIIPNELIFFGTVAAALYLGFSHYFDAGYIAWEQSLLGAVCCAAPMLLLDRISLIFLKRDGFGYGDVKLMALCGLFLGVWAGVLALLSSFALCGIAVIILYAFKKIGRRDYVAFGPFICVSVYIWLLFGPEIISWYVEMLS